MLLMCVAIEASVPFQTTKTTVQLCRNKDIPPQYHRPPHTQTIYRSKWTLHSMSCVCVSVSYIYRYLSISMYISMCVYICRTDAVFLHHANQLRLRQVPREHNTFQIITSHYILIRLSHTCTLRHIYIYIYIYQIIIYLKSCSCMPTPVGRFVRPWGLG
jgi:hypothetical protein